MMLHGWTMRLGMVAQVLLMASRVASADIVEAGNVTNVVASAPYWDLRLGSEGGCGQTGCDPRMTRDGDDNTVAESRWSCGLGVSTSGSCELYFEFDDYFDFSYLIIYFHESDDTTQVAIPFDIAITSVYTVDHTDLTSPGTALGAGQRVSMPAGTYGNAMYLMFDLTNDQSISVEIYLDVDDPADVVIETLPTISTVRVNTVANVVASASYWDLRTDAGCGETGCDPRLAHDGDDNTVAASRWSCEAKQDQSAYVDQGCYLMFNFGSIEDQITVSHLVIYIHESDDATKEPISIDVFSGYSGSIVTSGSFVTVPGTELGAGHRVNLNRPLTTELSLYPTLAAGQWIDISEVEIYVEVTQTEVFVSAAEAWNEVAADTVTTVTAFATGSVAGFGPANTTDGDDNTVAASYWSCQMPTGTSSSSFTYDSCQLFFELNDIYTISFLMLYVHESNDATREPVQFDVYDCFFDSFSCHEDNIVGSSTTVPGTPLGEGERVNLIRPSIDSLGIIFNVSAGATIDISEVGIYVQTPDATPTPSPFVVAPETEAPLYSWSTDDDDYFSDYTTTADDTPAPVDDFTDYTTTADDAPAAIVDDDDSEQPGADQSQTDDFTDYTAMADDAPGAIVGDDDSDDGSELPGVDQSENGAIARGLADSGGGLIGAVAVGVILNLFTSSAM